MAAAADPLREIRWQQRRQVDAIGCEPTTASLRTSPRSWVDVVLTCPQAPVLADFGDRATRVVTHVQAAQGNLTRAGRPYAVMENVVVSADHRVRGVGTAMVRRALDGAWKAGCYKVMLLMGAENQHTQHVYEHAGFDESAKRGYVAKPPRSL